MANRRVALQYVTTAANANDQVFTFNTPDTWQKQIVRKVFVGITTAGVQFGLYVRGAQKLTIDCTRFAAGNSDVSVDVEVPPSIAPEVHLKNLAGAALANVPIMLEYDVDQE